MAAKTRAVERLVTGRESIAEIIAAFLRRGVDTIVCPPTRTCIPEAIAEAEQQVGRKCIVVSTPSFTCTPRTPVEGFDLDEVGRPRRRGHLASGRWRGSRTASAYCWALVPPVQLWRIGPIVGGRVASLLRTLGSIGVATEDREELVLEKRIYTISVEFAMILVLPLYGLIHLAFGESSVALYCFFVPCALMAMNLAMSRFFKDRCHVFLMWALTVVVSQAALSTVLLGGFRNYNVQILWGLLCPLGAMVMSRRSRPVIWFSIYLLLTMAIG